jgi:hypothetical protein
MKRGILFVCLFLLLVPVGVSAAGNISVSSTPSGAIIFLDGSDISHVTPYTIPGVTSGTHTILLRFTGYNDYSQAVVVTDGGTSVVSQQLVVASAPAPTINGVSPSSGINTSVVSGVAITGTGFSTTGSTVVLVKSGLTNITGTVTSRTATLITCNFPITGKPAGDWDVIVTNSDGQSVTRTSGFQITSASSAATLSSITPSSGKTNNTISITALVGTGFSSNAGIRLRRSTYNDIIGSVSSVNSAGTKIVGSFDLDDQVAGDYQVCVYNDASTYTCGLTFTITSDNTATNSSVYFETNPTGATVWLNNVRVGTSTFTYYNATPGTFKVLIQKTGYSDYSDTVVVLQGKRVTYYAKLSPVSSDTTVATTATTVRTATTIKKSTVKVPTPWSSATTATTASPVDPAVIAGAAGLGLALFVIRKH